MITKLHSPLCFLRWPIYHTVITYLTISVKPDCIYSDRWGVSGWVKSKSKVRNYLPVELNAEAMWMRLQVRHTVIAALLSLGSSWVDPTKRAWPIQQSLSLDLSPSFRWHLWAYIWKYNTEQLLDNYAAYSGKLLSIHVVFLIVLMWASSWFIHCICHSRAVVPNLFCTMHPVKWSLSTPPVTFLLC